MAATTTIRLPPKLRARLGALAKQTGRSAHSLIVEAVERHAAYEEQIRSLVKEALAADAEIDESGEVYRAEYVHACESTSSSYTANLSLFKKVLAAVPGVERKGDTVPYGSHNGHMFTYLSKAGVMALRLPERDRDSFLKKYATRLCAQYGIVQKEYVEVPDALLRKTAELKNYLKISFAYVGELKPKGAAKKKPARKR
jgi:predicted transcriptional regulator